MKDSSWAGRTKPLWPSLLITALLAILSVTGGFEASVLVLQSLPKALTARTDVVGYPIQHNFNVFVYFQLYYVGVVVFPAVTAGIFLVGRRLTSRWRVPGAELAPLPYEEKGSGLPGQISRVLLVGAVFGLISAIGVNATGAGTIHNPFWRVVVACTLLYAVGVVAMGSASHALKRTVSPRVAMTWFNALAAPVTLTGISIASSVTALTVTADGTTHPYPWMPAAVPALILLVVAASVSIGLARAQGNISALGAVETMSILVSAVPAAIFVVFAHLYGAAGDLFVSGEQTVPAKLIQQGWLPWRDLVLLHGPLQDGLIPLAGMTVFGQSFWGNSTGFAIQIEPLGLVFIFAFWAFLFRKNWAFLAFSTVVMTDSLIVAPHYRFLVWPLILILFYWVITQRRALLSALLALALVVQMILVPEAAYCTVSCAGVLFGFELTHWQGGRARIWRGLALNFRSTLVVAIVGVAATGVFVLWLALNQSLSAFVLYLESFVADHALLGGTPPMTWPVWQYPYEEFSVPVALVIAFFYGVSRLVKRVQLTPIEWVMAVEALFAFLYYPKFLDRMDWHVGEAYAIGTPLVFYTVFRVVSWTEARFRLRIKIANFVTGHPMDLVFRHPLSVGLLLVVLVFPGTAPWKQLSTVAAQYRPMTTYEPWQSQIGYSDNGQSGLSNSNTFGRATYNDLAAVLGAYLSPSDKLFDFSNAPGLYHFLLPYRPATSFYDIQEAYHEKAQLDVIRQLKTSQPRLVVFYNDRFGLGDWDGIANTVREYDVAEYLLQKYKPFFEIHGQLFYERNDLNLKDPGSLGIHLSEAPVTSNLYYQSSTCDWGYSPEFLSITSSALSDSASIAPAVQQTGGTDVLTLPSGDKWSNYRWMEITSSSALAQETLALSDGGVGGLHRTITFGTLAGHGNVYKVPLGSCSQWWGYGSSPLYLSSSGLEPITQVKLSP